MQSDVDKVRDRNGTAPHHLDGGITPVAQSLDIAPNAIVKHHPRKRYDVYAIDAPIDRQGYIKAPTRGMIAQWVLEGWEGVTAKTIVRSFVSSGLKKVADYSAEDREKFGLDVMKVNGTIQDVLNEDCSETEVSAILSSNAQFQQELDQHNQFLNPSALEEEDAYNSLPASGAANLESVIAEEEEFMNAILQYVDEDGNIL